MDAIYSILRPWLSQSVMKLKSLIGCLCYKPVFFILKNVMLNIINQVECELNLRTWIFFEKRLIYLFLMSYASGDWNFFYNFNTNTSRYNLCCGVQFVKLTVAFSCSANNLAQFFEKKNCVLIIILANLKKAKGSQFVCFLLRFVTS